MERTLLDQFRRGERAALTQVYAMYQADVLTVFKYGGIVHEHRLSAAPRSEWADLVQETFFAAFEERTRQNYDGLRPYKAFIVAIAKHKLTAYWRKHGREVPVDFANAEWVQPADISYDLPPNELQIAQQFIQELSGELLDVYRARYDRGLTQEVAATELGVTRQHIRTVEARLKRALRRKISQAALVEARKG